MYVLYLKESLTSKDACRNIDAIEGKGRIRAKTGIGKDSSVNHAYIHIYIPTLHW